MRGRLTVEAWQKAVRKDRELTARTKNVLLYMGIRMRSNMYVSVPRSTVAANTGVVSRTVDRAIAEAHKAHYLDTIVHGRKHVTAVYVGIVPTLGVVAGRTPQRDTPCRAENCHNCRAETAQSGSQRDTRCRTISTEPTTEAVVGTVGWTKRDRFDGREADSA